MIKRKTHSTCNLLPVEFQWLAIPVYIITNDVFPCGHSAVSFGRVDWPHREQTDYLHMMGISYM